MKKILTVLLCAILLVAVSMPALGANFTDTEGKTCETAVEVLSALGIVEGETEGIYDPAASLTRAEMATIILRAMNMAETASGQNIFADVPSGHWAYANIASAYQLGIINGVSEKEFMPDTVVSYEQAVKMVVAALGYTVQAEAGGGYPSGYLVQAAQLDILRGVSVGGEMSRGDMAVLVYNALNVELFLQSSFGDDAYQFVTSEENTLLSYYLKVTYFVGEVEATPMARLGGNAQRLLDDEVLACGTVMKAGETAAKDMLGIRSDIYAKTLEGMDEPTILAIIPKKGVEVIELTASEVSVKTDTNSFIYENETGKEMKVNIGNARLVWNGREETKTVELLTPEVGMVRLISESGGDCSLIIVQSFINYVVNNVNREDSIIYFKGEGIPPITVDYSGHALRTEMRDLSGFPIEVKDLAEWDVLSIAESDSRHSARVRQIYRSKEAVKGVITEISRDSVVINGTTYPKAETLCVGKIELSQNAAYYMDYTGTIVAADANYQGTGRIYGWLQSAAFSKGLDAEPLLKLFTDSGEFKVFSLKDTIDFNGFPTKSDTLIGEKTVTPDSLWAADVAPTLWADGKVVPQLIAYKLNDEGDIISIETAVNKSDPGLDPAEKYGNEFSMDWYYNADLGDLAGNPTEFNGKPEGNTAKELSSRVENIRGIFFGHVRTSNSTKLFVIPTDLTNEKGYLMLPLSSFSFDANRLADYVSFYDVDDSYFCGAMVIHNYFGKGEGGAFGDTYLDGNYPSAIVTGISTILGENGETLNALKLLTSSGANATVYYDEELRVLYRAANANIKEDPAWYTVDEYDNRLPRTDEKLTSRPTKMYMEPKDIMLGDVVIYDAESDGKLKTLGMSFRAGYPGNVEVYGSSNTYGTTAVRNYYGGPLRINGVVKKAMSEGPILEINLADAVGMPKLNENGQNVKALRMLQSLGKFVIWDRKTETARVISIQDIMDDDEIFSFWETTTQVFTVIYR